MNNSPIAIQKDAAPSRWAVFVGMRAVELCGWKESGYTKAIEYLKALLERLHERGFGRFITDETQGFGQLVLEAYHQLWLDGFLHDTEMVCYVPNDEGWYTYWKHDRGLFSLYKSHERLRHATLMTHAVDDRTKPGTPEYTELVKRRNRAMVACADLVVSLSDSAKKDMATETVEYAKTKPLAALLQLNYDTTGGSLELDHGDYDL